jgi:signal transduction histidine kinase
VIVEAQRDLARNSLPGALLYPIAAALIGFSTNLSGDPWIMWGFVAALAVSGASRALWAWRNLHESVVIQSIAPVQISMLVVALLYGMFSGWCILEQGFGPAGMLSTLSIASFSLGGAMILAQDRRVALAFAFLILTPGAVASAALKPAGWFVEVVYTGLLLAFISSMIRNLHREYWITRISHRLLELHTVELERAKDRAETAARLRAEFLQNVSHELRTPMNGVMGMLELANMADDDEEREEFLGHVKSSAESMMTTIDSILAFSGEVGANPLRPTQVCPETLARAALDRHRKSAGERGLDMRCAFDPGLPDVVQLDAVLLGQALDILIDNAIKFTHQGSVELRMGVLTGPDGGRLQVEVIDTGIGIAAENQELVFEPFRQVDGTVTRTYGGLGIGLPVAQRIIGQMGGALSLSSELGAGSCFRFTVGYEAVELEPALALTP